MPIRQCTYQPAPTAVNTELPCESITLAQAHRPFSGIEADARRWMNVSAFICFSMSPGYKRSLARFCYKCHPSRTLDAARLPVVLLTNIIIISYHTNSHLIVFSLYYLVLLCISILCTLSTLSFCCECLFALLGRRRLEQTRLFPIYFYHQSTENQPASSSPITSMPKTITRRSPATRSFRIHQKRNEREKWEYKYKSIRERNRERV